MENQGLNIKSIIREAEKSRRTMIIDKKYPGVRDRLNKWSSTLDGFEIMIPNHIELQYISLGKQAEKLFYQYIKGDDDINLEEFYIIFKKADKELYKISEYVEKNEHNPDVVTKEIESFLKTNNDTTAINQLKRNGYTNALNAGYITEPNYMSKMASKLNEIQHKSYICFVNVKSHTYIVESSDFQGIGLELSPHYFMECFGRCLFKDKLEVDFRALIKHAKINSELSISKFIRESSQYLHAIGCETDSFDIIHNSIIVRKIGEDIYTEIDLSKYVNFIKPIVFKVEPFDLVPFRNFIISRPQYTKKQLNDIREVYRKSSKGK
jgi:hypothetical protein